MARNGDFASSTSRGSAASASLSTVDADPGAVLEEHGADTVDDLVAEEEPAPEPPAPDIEADDEDVAALFGDDLEAPEYSRTGDAAAADARTGADAPERPGADAAPSTRVSSRWDGSAADTPEASGDGDVEEILPDRGADVLADLERAAEDVEATTAAVEPDLEREATDEDVAEALDAAEEVYEGELPDDVPFE